MSAALLTAAGSVTAAVLAALVTRLDRGLQLGWLAAALGCYGLLVMPAASAEVVGGTILGASPAVQTTARIAVASLLVVAATGAASPGRHPALVASASVTGLVGVVAGLGAIHPHAVAAIAAARPVHLAEAVAWFAAVVATAFWATRPRAAALRSAALGLILLGITHAVQIGTAFVPADLLATFSLARFTAIALVLVTLGRHAHRTVTRLDADHAAQEDELCIARLQLSRAAERDHELRSGLAGLAGATGLLRTEQVGTDTATLGSAVVSELIRLDDLLRAGHSGPSGRAQPPVGYAVAQVLSGLVALRRSAGMSIELAVEPDLRAVGSSTVLAQVVTNLLGNAAVHAPGSPVRITAYRAGARVVVRVRDFGPGIPPGQEAAVFERGVADKRHGGSGLGLHICYRLLAAEGGAVAVSTAAADRPGCTIIVRVPAAGSGARHASQPLMISGAS
ncbi:MAG: sensor histidine kinase [Pseudonocardia sp.]